MAQTALLVENNDVTAYTRMQGNTDPDLFDYAIRNAQKLMLRPVLGKELYQKIMTDFATTISITPQGIRTNALEGIYREMYEDYIFDIVVNGAASYYYAEGAFTISNAGIIKHQPENTVTASEKEIGRLTFDQRNKTKDYIRQLEDFLSKNAQDIPEFQSTSCSKAGRNLLGFYIGDNQRTWRNY